MSVGNGGKEVGPLNLIQMEGWLPKSAVERNYWDQETTSKLGLEN